MAVTPKNIGQQAALTMGWDGSGQGAGGEIAWRNSLSPQQLAQYNQITGGNDTSPVNPNLNIASVPALQEPLTDWEKQGYTSLATPQSTTGMQDALSQLKSLTGQQISGANNLVTQATQPITSQQISDIANPNAAGLNQNLSIAAQQIKAQVLQNQGLRGGASFGDTSTGSELGKVDEGLLTGQNTNNYNTWAAALQALQQQNSNKLTGAGTMLNGATVGGQNYGTAYNESQGIGNANIANAQNEVAAGGAVRGYNQGIDNTMQSNLLAQQGFPLQQLASLLPLITQNYVSPTNTSQTGGMANGASTGGNILGAIASAIPIIGKLL